MDLQLLRSLQSIKKIEEDDPTFRTETIEPDSFTPTHPSVIYVDQKAVDGVDLDQSLGDKLNLHYAVLSEDRFGRRIKTNSLTNAMRFASVLTGTYPRWTIVLLEGLYIDPNFHMDKKIGADSTLIEIFGMSNVRILQSFHSNFAQFYVGKGKLTIRNVRFYDRRSSPYRGGPFLGVENAHLQLIDVKMSVPEVGCLYVGDGASASFKRCSFSECLFPLQLEGGSANLEDCFYSRCGTEIFRTTGSAIGGTLKATRVRYVDCSRILAWSASHYSFVDCQFVHGIKRNFAVTRLGPKQPPHTLEFNFACFNVNAGSTVECDGCMIRGYEAVTRVCNSSSKVTLRRCQVSVTHGVAEVIENASVEVNDCHIQKAVYLLKIGFNLSGKTKFVRNKLSASTQPLFLVDQMSKEPTHDVKNADFQLAFFDYANSRATDAEKSSYTKAFYKAVESGPLDRATPVFNSSLMKQCGLCFLPEGQAALNARAGGRNITPPPKFQFCSKCRQVCYCSKECQSKHWPDHKLSCTKRAVPKPSVGDKIASLSLD